MTRNYLETSAHIERWAGEEQTRSTIFTLLGSNTHATSTLVLREWKHIVEGGTAEIINAMEQSLDAATALARLSKGFGRRPAQFLRLLSMLTRAGGGDLSDPETMLRADQFLRYRSRRWFEHQIDTIRDLSECELARERVARNDRGLLALRDSEG